MSKTFKIKGLDCANCAAHLEEKIKNVEGVENASISFFTEKLIIDFSEGNEDETMIKIKKLIKKEEPDTTLEEI